MSNEMEYVQYITIQSDEYRKLKHKEIDEEYSGVENGIQKLMLPSLREIVFSKILSEYHLFQEFEMEHSKVISIVNEYLNDPEKIEYINQIR